MLNMAARSLHVGVVSFTVYAAFLLPFSPRLTLALPHRRTSTPTDVSPTSQAMTTAPVPSSSSSMAAGLVAPTPRSATNPGQDGSLSATSAVRQKLGRLRCFAEAFLQDLLYETPDERPPWGWGNSFRRLYPASCVLSVSLNENLTDVEQRALSCVSVLERLRAALANITTDRNSPLEPSKVEHLVRKVGRAENRLRKSLARFLPSAKGMPVISAPNANRSVAHQLSGMSARNRLAYLARYTIDVAEQSEVLLLEVVRKLEDESTPRLQIIVPYNRRQHLLEKKTACKQRNFRKANASELPKSSKERFRSE